MEQGFDLGRGEQWENQGVIQVNWVDLVLQ